MKLYFIVFFALLTGAVRAVETSATVTGELRTWHKITLVCPGPSTSEEAGLPDVPGANPFTDYRLNAVFTHSDSGKTYTVPGYYAADGNAAETGATGGNLWHVHFAPDESGTWTFALSFRTGTAIAVDANPAAGISAGYFDGTSGSFEIQASDKTGSDLRAKGRLEYVGKHHLRFAGTGEYFMKCGVDSPENLLAYDDFDETPDVENRLKSWSAHAPSGAAAVEIAPFTWKAGKGSELLGAVHYLASQGLNGFSFLTFSVDGDDDNVFPHLINGTVHTYEGTGDGDTSRWGSRLHHDRFDVSKLDQWERVFAYSDTKGMHLHFKTQETENDQKMDGGALGPERKLYFRELVARFGHHLALNWNLGEENSNSDAERIAFTQWFHDHDPYRHPVVMHTFDTNNQGTYNSLLGSSSKLTGASLQPADDDEFDTVFADTLRWVTNSFNSIPRRPWVVACDEPGDSGVGLRLNSNGGSNHADARKNALWANPMAGGGGIEWYFGGSSNNPDSDIKAESYLSRSAFWPICKHMLDFWKISGAPFWEMANANPLVTGSGNFCLAKPGDCYVIQLKSGGATTLNLTGHPGTFSVQWYDPRNGGGLQGPTPTTEVTGDALAAIGHPPAQPSEDWIVLVRKVSLNTPPVFSGASLSTGYGTVATISLNKLIFTASDAEGDALSVTAAGPASARGGTVTFGGSIVYTPASGFSGKDVFPVTIRDSQNATTTALVTVLVGPPSPGGGAAVNPPRITLNGGSVIVRFQGIPGITYAIQRSADLVFWQTIHTATANGIGTLEHTDASPLSPNGFYRLNPP